MTYFKSVEDFKSKAEFFPKGRIVPKRIMNIMRTSNSKKISRFKRHCDFIFDSDTYVARVDGHNVIVSFDDAPAIMRLKGAHRNISLYGNPYGPGENLICHFKDDENFCQGLNDAIEELKEAPKARIIVA